MCYSFNLSFIYFQKLCDITTHRSATNKNYKITVPPRVLPSSIQYTHYAQAVKTAF